MNLNHGEVRRVFALAALGPGDAVAMARLAAGAGVPEGVPFARARTELLIDGVAELDGLGRSSAGLHVEVVILQEEIVSDSPSQGQVLTFMLSLILLWLFC